MPYSCKISSAVLRLGCMLICCIPRDRTRTRDIDPQRDLVALQGFSRGLCRRCALLGLRAPRRKPSLLLRPQLGGLPRVLGRDLAALVPVEINARGGKPAGVEVAGVAGID